MTETYTPEISLFITGKVIEFEDNQVVLDIICKYLTKFLISLFEDSYFSWTGPM